MEPVKDQKLAFKIALFVVLLWSTVGTAVKLALQFSSYIEVVILASFSSAVILVMIYLFQIYNQPTKAATDIFDDTSNKIKDNDKTPSLVTIFKRSPAFYLLCGFLNPILYYLVLFAAYERLPAQIAQPINYTWAIVLSLLAVPFLKHKLSLGDILGLVICYFGVVILVTGLDFRTGLMFDLAGVLLAILSTLIWAFYWIVNVRNSASPTTSVMLNFLCSIPWLVIMSVYYWQDFTFHPQTIAASIYIGLVEMSVAFVLWLKAMQLAKSTAQISVLIYLSPFLSLVFFYLFLGEKIYFSTVIALIVIVTGLLIQKKLNQNSPK
ncbi:DMT family transporter [Psychrosphaera sp. 1_MG-2023]|uniref:DMT family transporter n=1 Tax=Psychrosphaera sp. 1_MG-2023 TaxID=3062643 RepID=UPI0026E2CA58|nr:DMT family transporter [Psychrosphaera sp. 1_MG-2023]MDO6720037.1 DMT family transporter [Psychrosphaera sp. 1_MG-2023]